MPKRKSEFGMGLCYSLGLFLEHSMRLYKFIEDWEKMRKLHPNNFSESSAISLWMNGAGDHFYELQTEQAPKHLRKRCRVLQSKCLHWRLHTSEKDPLTTDNAKWAIQEAKDLLRLIDKANGIKTEKGQWE